jgi:hypothetical protein
MLNSLIKRPLTTNPDFDFLMGIWRVHHRYLLKRLAGCHDWIEFDGCCAARKILNGFGNTDESEINLPGTPYRGMTVRTWDPEMARWSIYWLDSRRPGQMTPPVKGGFAKGVGTFFGEDEYERRAIRVRFVWSRIARDAARWEQAFSLDEGDSRGASWETNWIMDFKRM